MDSQDPRSAVSRVMNGFRRFIRFVQILPFAYLILYGAVLLFEPFDNIGLVDAIGAVAYMPVSGIVFLLVLSRMMHLCIWHKAACSVPFASRVTDFIDNNIIQFTQTEVVIINTAIGLACVIFIILAIRHFAHGR